MNRRLTTQQIGKCGELLVQYRLLQNGIESAPMTTDSGIDLVAYSNRGNMAVTIQVKTNQKPKPGGGKVRPSIDWWIPQESKAELFAFVELDQEQIWIVRNKEMESLAQQKPKGRYHFFMVIDPEAKDRKDKKEFRLFEFEKYKLENRISDIFKDEKAKSNNNFLETADKNYYLNLRNRYLPENLKLILLTESPPASGKYFYDKTERMTEPLFKEMMKFVKYSPLDKEAGLKYFQNNGCFLIDATYRPVNHLTDKARNDIILEDFDMLTAGLEALSSGRKAPILLVKANICRLLEERLKAKGFNVINNGTIVPYPSTGQQKRFHEKINLILENET